MLSAISTFARRVRCQVRASKDSGQSLIETALAIPFLLLIALNAINFAYYFFVAINLAAAPRNAVEYSVQGFATPGQLTIPQEGSACGPATKGDTTYVTSVSTLAYDDIIKVLPGPASPCPNIGSVQVCNSQTAGGGGTSGSGSSLVTQCTAYGPSTTYFPATQNNPTADPEAPNFVLDRVDVVYTVKPLIGGTIFGVTQFGLVPNFTFHRQVSMREMN